MRSCVEVFDTACQQQLAVVKKCVCNGRTIFIGLNRQGMAPRPMAPNDPPPPYVLTHVPRTFRGNP